MAPSWRTAKKFFLACILVGLTVGAIYLTRPDKPVSLNPFAAWIRDIAAPVQEGLWRATRGIKASASFVFSLGRENARTRALQEQVAALQGEVRRLRALEAENARLKALLEYRTTRYPTAVVAAVIGRNPDNWFGMVSIDRGRDAGVTPGAVVVTPAGLVGRVMAVSRNTAEVLLITDPRSAVGAVVYETHTPGIVHGNLGSVSSLKMRYVAKDATVRRGFLVLTSNLSGVFPPGIPVGTVTRVEDEESGLFKTLYLTPAADLDRIEEVLVLRAVEPTGN
uniref:Cell shape-determining protein MreC n=1 Tax=Ammonifex degensii TaxID=42838 RepID=A0A7C2HUR6_9THEO